ncbi:MAG: alpha-L-arabinofuranosidase C-terminal domain-containing protein [Rhodothermales bacterium]|nr:alpha-L-arabinofuranosidase C-terminal domain-containing protein [Rhodothermales bacterium]
MSDDSAQVVISRHIYGHFAEHLGRGIYDGFWAKDDSGQWGYREDIIEALRKIKIPNLRWPGGCFADYYHWRDGIGPTKNRPTIVNTIWGGVTEDNSFGTHEFMELAERLGAAPIVVGNVGSGTVEEMADWWEYINFPGVSPMADLRRANGRERPWNVRFWGVGNESWGCGGNMTPSYYADVYKRFATFLHSYGDVAPFRIATGPAGDNYDWTEVVMREAGELVDGLDVHHYTITGTWAKKGHATRFTEAEWFEAMRRAWYMEELIAGHSAIMDRYDPEKRVWLIVGEWGMWHEVEAGTNPGFLYQQNTLRDALVASLTLDVFNRNADRVRMANIAQTVNVLQAMILTRGSRMILTPTYHVFDFYSVHHDARLQSVSIDRGRYEHDGQTLAAVSASASRQSTGALSITLTNTDPKEPRTIRIEVEDADLNHITGRVLTADEMNSHNTFDRPQHVSPQEFVDFVRKGSTLVINLPPKSLVLLQIG